MASSYVWTHVEEIKGWWKKARKHIAYALPTLEYTLLHVPIYLLQLLILIELWGKCALMKFDRSMPRNKRSFHKQQRHNSVSRALRRGAHGLAEILPTTVYILAAVA